MSHEKKSSQRWLKEHLADPYVKQAQQAGYRSRAVYKLLEIEERDHLFKPGMTVIDLGASPGAWSQLVVKLIQPHGHLIAVDLLTMDPIEGVDFIQGDFSNHALVNQLIDQLSARTSKQLFSSKQHAARSVLVDWVISDMAPNMSGNESVDIPRSIYLAELVIDFALQVLNPQGGVLIKVFQEEGFAELFAQIRQKFNKVYIRKPKASRGRSREVYILARCLKVKRFP